MKTVMFLFLFVIKAVACNVIIRANLILNISHLDPILFLNQPVIHPYYYWMCY